MTYAAITIAIRLRYDYDPTTTYRARLLPFDAIRRDQKTNTVFRRSRVVVQGFFSVQFYTKTAVVN